MLRTKAGYFTGDYFEWQGARAAASAAAVVPLLLELLGPRSVVDVGCGTGGWLEVFADRGVTDVLGVDGPHIDPGWLRIPEDAFVAMDLEHPGSLDRRFDLALSLEAAHYLSEGAARELVRFLAELAPAVVFSAAIPGQSGGPALNRQWPSYWSDHFAARGFTCHDWLRPQLWERDDVDWWYAQNALLYVHRDRKPALALEQTAPLPLVHPRLLEHVLAYERDDDADSPVHTILRRLRRERHEA